MRNPQLQRRILHGDGILAGRSPRSPPRAPPTFLAARAGPRTPVRGEAPFVFPFFPGAAFPRPPRSQPRLAGINPPAEVANPRRARISQSKIVIPQKQPV